MVNYRITVCYDGLDFYGWQRQPRLKTIQGELEKAIEKITELPVKVIGAGRTDAGVHARGQVANFHTICQLENETFLRALNGHLPWSIRVTDLRTVSPNFHARRLALAKTYQYRILQAASPDPFRLRYTLFWPYPLDFEAMAEAARLFRRKDDFSSFSANEDKNPIREV
ncbi:MAG: tRNA pseudouridine(38-40) synthase TruA, partial [Candidatus Aminicenantes bacterium]